MLTTIDAAGRIVIPKSLRTALGLVGGSEVNVTLHDGLIEIEPSAVDMQWEQSGRISLLYIVEASQAPQRTVIAFAAAVQPLRRGHIKTFLIRVARARATRAEGTDECECLF